ncbi:MAG: hypothetical protein WCP57_08300 [Bacteroidota bacterium]
MKSISKIVLILIISFSFVANSFAQEKSMESKLEEYKIKLSLSASQYENIKKILEESKTTKKANETKYASDKKALMEANKTLRKSTEGKIEAQLTDKQKAIYQQLKEEKHAENEPKTINERIQHKTDEMTTQLGLSVEQSSKVKAIFTEYMPKIQAIKDQYKTDEETAKAKIQPIRKEMNSKIAAVLTDAQKAKLKEMKQEDKH